MSNFPTAIDAAASLYSPVDAFSTKPLETTANGAIGAGDSMSVLMSATAFRWSTVSSHSNASSNSCCQWLSGLKP